MERLTEISDEEYHELWMDLTIPTPNASTMEEAMATPGCCVKSKHTKPGAGDMPAFFGRVLSHDAAADKVVIISYPKERPVFKWEGTVAQYHSQWRCD